MEQRPIWKSIVIGMIASIITALVLSIAVAGLLNKAVIPQTGIQTAGIMILLAATLAGSIVAAQLQRGKLIITCALSALGWLVVCILFKAAFFGAWTGMNYTLFAIVPVIGMGASLIPTGRKVRRIRR